MDKNHIFGHGGQRISQQLVCEIALIAQIKFVQQKAHQFAVARIAHRLVIELLHPAQVRFAHRAQSARGGKRFQYQTINENHLQPFQRRNHLRFPVADDFAIVDVLVDHTLR